MYMYIGVVKFVPVIISVERICCYVWELNKWVCEWDEIGCVLMCCCVTSSIAYRACLIARAKAILRKYWDADQLGVAEAMPASTSMRIRRSQLTSSWPHSQMVAPVAALLLQHPEQNGSIRSAWEEEEEDELKEAEYDVQEEVKNDEDKRNEGKLLMNDHRWEEE